MSSPGTFPSLVILLASTDLSYPPRRLLLHASVFSHHDQPPPPRPPPASSSAAASPTATAAGASSGGGGPSLDANVIMILAVLLCALVCAIGLNSIVRCALRCCSLSASTSPLAVRGATASSAAAGCGGQGGGVKKAALKSIPTMAYKVDAGMPCGDGGSSSSSIWSECAICLSEFKEGERVRVLPGCNHGFHVRCVDRWLRGNATCPTCRGSCVVVVASGQKKKLVTPTCTGLHQAAPAAAAASAAAPAPTPPPPPPPPPPRASAISPLDREGVLVEGVLVEYMGRY